MSGAAAEADRQLSPLDDHRDPAPAPREGEHRRHRVGVAQDVAVVDVEASAAEVVTGRPGMRSAVLAVDEDLHRAPPDGFTPEG